MIEFDKYEKHGAYHWEAYANPTTYQRHANRVKQWVRKGETLDIGAGDGLITSLIDGATGIDNNKLAVKLAKEKGANVQLGNAYRLRFKKGSFDNVLMADVIEHLETPETALKEAYRVLRSDARLYITTPPAYLDGKLHDKYHCREYKPAELVRLVESCGFKLSGGIVMKFKRMYAKFTK